MQIFKATRNVILQLSEIIGSLSPEQYTQSVEILTNASIGQHLRHIIELFQCLDSGYENGYINYEKRKRDRSIETDKIIAAELLHEIGAKLKKDNKVVQIEVNYDEFSHETVLIESNYYREVVYNLEHAIHHMALIRIGVLQVSDIVLPENFCVASSTIKYRKLSSQLPG